MSHLKGDRANWISDLARDGPAKKIGAGFGKPLMMIPCGEALSRILLSALGRPTVMLAGQKGVPAVLGENAKKNKPKAE